MSETILIHNPDNLPTAPYDSFVDLQGDFKTYLDPAPLADRIAAVGFKYPFFCYESPIECELRGETYPAGTRFIIDAHSRQRALSLLQQRGTTIPPVPFLRIAASSLAAAQDEILFLNSQYGEIAVESDFLKEALARLSEEDVKTLRLPDVDVDAILKSLETPPDVNPDDMPEIDEDAPVITRTGDLWIVGEYHRVLCGDSTKREDVARLMGGEQAAVVSDPPYGINVNTAWLSALHVQRGKPSCKNDDRLINDDGTLELSFVYQYSEWLVFGFPFIARNEDYTGLLVWDKRGDGGENGLGNPVEVAASNAFNGYRLKRHLWAGYVREAGEKREDHPTQKPVGIMVDAINLVKNQNIFDPFLGSGTTLISCEQTGRTCYGLEISPRYVDIILRRYMQTTGRDDVFLLDGDRRMPFADVKASRLPA